MSDHCANRGTFAVKVLKGRRLSRRDFLKAAGYAGLGAAGLGAAGSLPLSAAAQTDGDRRPVVPELTATDIAARLGNDPERIYRFVAEHVRYEPYAGALRGAPGAYAGRAGNSVDQAILLATLLEAAGLVTRYVFGVIDHVAVDRLLASSVADPEMIRQETFEALADVLPDEKPEALPGLDPALRRQLQEAEAHAEDVREWAESRIIASAETIQSALAEQGVSLPSGFTQVPRLEVEQHAWVQLDVGDGEWLDLDPTILHAAMGDTLTTVATIAEEVPDELFHQVELAIIGERLDGAGLRQEQLLRVSGRAADWAGKPIMVVNASEEAMPTSMSAAFASVTGLRMYFPTLVIGEDAYVGAPLRFRVPEDGDGGIGGGFFDTGELPEETTAAWTIATVRVPDAEPSTSTRPVFDRFGPEARLDTDPDPTSLSPVEIADFGGDVGTEVLAVQGVSCLSVATGTPRRTSEVLRLAEDDPLLPAAVPLAQQLMDELIGSEVLPRHGVRTFVEAPNLTAFTALPGISEDGTPFLRGMLDIWHRDRGTVPVEGVDPNLPPALMPGIAAHVAERVALGAPLRQAAVDAESEPPGVGALFEAASGAGVGLRVLTLPEDAVDLPYSAMAQHRLEERLRDGWLAIAPDQPVILPAAGRLATAPRPLEIASPDRLAQLGADVVARTGWWLVHPASGRVFDEMDDGRGQEVTEEIELESVSGGLSATVARCWGALLVTGLLIATAIGNAIAAAVAEARGQVNLATLNVLMALIAGATFQAAFLYTALCLGGVPLP